MNLSKVDKLALGRGNLTDNSNAAIVFSSNNIVSNWSAATNYAQYNVVEYSNKMYRSKIAGNLNNQPDTSPNQWEVLFSFPKSGDICVVLGSTPTILQRNSAEWANTSEATNTIALVDGQVTPTDAIVFLGSVKPFAKIEYTIKRGAGHGRKRHGNIDILSDGLGSVNHTHDFDEIGIDVNVPINVVAVGGTTKVQYTSAAEGVAIELTYVIVRGW